MKVLILLLMLAACSPAFAEVYVLYDPATNAVVSVDADDSAIPGSGQEKKVIAGDLRDTPLQYPPEFYRLRGRRLVVDREKVDAEDIRLQRKEKREREMRIIERRSLRESCETLVAEGRKFTEIKCADLEAGQ